MRTVNSEKAMSDVEQKCADRGIRLTRRRKEVLRTLVLADSALSAYEIAEQCNAGSVYRILDFLRDQQFVHRLETANKYISCSHLSCGHDHAQSQFLICNECRKVEEIDFSSEAFSVMEKAASAAGFSSISPQLEVRGLCDSCETS